MRMRFRVFSVMLAVALLLGLFCLPVAAEVTYTEMPITGVASAGTGSGHWRIVLNSTGTLPASGFYTGLTVEVTGITATARQVYNSSGYIMLILWGSGTTAPDGATVTLKAGSATSDNDSSLGITIPQDYTFRYNGTTAAWELQIETVYTDMEVTSLANAVVSGDHWRINLNVSEALPATGFYTGLEVEVTGITATAREVYNNSGYLMLILWGSGTTAPDGATVTLKAGSATSSNDSSLGIRFSKDFTIRYDAASGTWKQYTEVNYTESAVAAVFRAHTDNGHWRFWLQMSTAMPTVNGAAFHEYKDWDVELNGLTATDPRVYSDSGYLLLVLNGSGTAAPAHGSTVTIKACDMINLTDASVGVRITEECVLTYDADQGTFVTGGVVTYTEITSNGVASAGTGNGHWRINLVPSTTLPGSGFYNGLTVEVSGITAGVDRQLYKNSSYLMLILWGSGTTAPDGATITVKAGTAQNTGDTSVGIRLMEDIVLRYSETAGTWVQVIDNTPKEFTFTAVDEHSGYTASGDYELWLTPSAGLPGEMNGTSAYSGLTASVNGGTATAATLTKTDTGALKLVVPAASVPAADAWTVTVHAGTAVSGDISLPMSADATAYINAFGVHLDRYVQDCGTDVSLGYITDNKQNGFYLSSTDSMPADGNWTTPIYAADEPESGVFLNGIKTRVYVKKITASQYYVCLNDSKVTPEIGDTVIISGRFDVDGYTVRFATHVFTFNGAEADPVWAVTSTAVQPIELKALTYNLDADEYAVLETRSDGGETVITKPGDYTVRHSIGGVTFTQSVGVCRDGDVNLDNVVDVRDAVIKRRNEEKSAAASAADTMEESAIRYEILGDKPTKTDDELPTAILGQTGSGTYITSLAATENGTTVFGVSDSNSGYTPLASTYDDYGFDYVFDFNGNRELRVLQLSDTQIIDSAQDEAGRLSAEEVAKWTQDKIDELLFNCLDAAVEAADPDIILITGDLNYGEFDGDGWCLQTLIAHMESLQIPWAPIFGNHDNEGVDGVRTTIAMQCGWLEDATYCLFNQRHNIGGNGNYTIALAQNGELVRTIYMLDSNYCTLTDDPDQTVTVSAGGTRHTFLGFTTAQINWMYAMGMRTNQLAGRTIPSFVCYHIPSGEFLKGAVANGYQIAEDSAAIKYTIGEDVAANSGDSGYKGGGWGTTINDRYLLPTLQKIGADGVFCGHQHVINTSFHYAGIRWTMGLKTGEYCDFPKEMGGTLATVSADGSEFTIERIVSQIAD